MFTDESRFALEPDDKRIRIGREQRTRNQSQNATEHHHAFRGGNIMVWAGISLRYRTDLHILKRGPLTDVRYLDEVLEPIVRLYAAAVGPTFVLMDDNARTHRADIVDDYLESEGIVRMAWPAYSPKLNPIENLWDALGRAVSLHFPPSATLIELETAQQEEWRLLNSAVVDHLIENMITRCKLYIQMRGGIPDPINVFFSFYAVYVSSMPLSDAYKNLILFPFLYIIIDFVAFYIFVLNFWK
ncbi:Transposable element Tcb1 transposase, partial [Stegodyphus mimosarum]